MDCSSNDQILIRLGAEIFCNNEKLGSLPVRDYRIKKDGEPEQNDMVMEDNIIKAILSALQQTAQQPAMKSPPNGPPVVMDAAMPSGWVKTQQGMQGKQACEHCASHKNCLLSRMKNTGCYSRLRELLRHPRPLHKGDRLFVPGDSFTALYLVKAGSFKSTLIDDEGNAQVVSFHYPADVLGLDGIQAGRYLYEVEALETSTVCALPLQFMQQLSREEVREVYQHLMGELTDIKMRENNLLMVLGRMHAEQRLANFLLGFAARPHAGGIEREFVLSMARYDIASYLGLAVETVSRLFRRLEEEGVLSAHRHSVCIYDINRLESIKRDGYRVVRDKKAS